MLCFDIMELIGTEVESIRTRKKYKNVVDEFKNVMEIIAEDTWGFTPGYNVWEQIQDRNYMTYEGQNQSSIVNCIEDCPRASEHIVMNDTTVDYKLHHEVYKPLDEAIDKESLQNTIIFCNYDYDL